MGSFPPGKIEIQRGEEGQEEKVLRIEGSMGNEEARVGSSSKNGGSFGGKSASAPRKQGAQGQERRIGRTNWLEKTNVPRHPKG